MEGAGDGGFDRLSEAMTLLLISRVVVSGSGLLLAIPARVVAALLHRSFGSISGLFPASFAPVPGLFRRFFSPLSALFPACFPPLSGLFRCCFTAVFRSLYKGRTQFRRNLSHTPRPRRWVPRGPIPRLPSRRVLECSVGESKPSMMGPSGRPISRSSRPDRADRRRCQVE